jgi:hypothetical protein
MNAERLHAICIELKESIDSVALLNKLKQVVGNLQNIVNNPQDAAQQQELTKNLNGLYEALRDFPSNYFSPAWQQALDELGGSQILGSNLEEKIRGILEKNQITTATAHQEIQKLFQELQQFKSAVDGVLTAFAQLRIGAEELDPGECEVGILIPRNAVHNNIQEFGKELQDLNFILGTFSELASGDRETFEIKAISSTELMVFLAAIPPVAACVAHAAEKIINFYKTLLEIKKLKGELKKQGLEEEEMGGINEHANTLMSNGVEEVTQEIVEEYYQGNDDNRKNELTNAVRIALNKLANRIDQGFNVEVRAEPMEEPEEGEEDKVSAEDQEKSEYVSRVLSASETLQFMKLTGPRILHLPEKPTKSKATKSE